LNNPPTSSLQRLLITNADFILSPKRFLFLISGLLLAVLLMKSLLFPGIGGDDGEQIVFAQYFDWGYVVRNPPLYTWFVILSQKVFGVSALAVNAVKFTTLVLLYWFLYRTGVLLFKDQRIAILAALSPLLIFHIAWDSLMGFSHSVLVATMYAATLYAVFHLEKNNRILSYIGLGAAIGCGILSKYAFIFFLIALCAAALFDAKLRNRLLNPKIMISLVTAAIIATPHLMWLYERHAAMAGELTPALTAQGAASHMLAAGKGILSSIKAMVGFLLPLLVFLAIFFPKAWRLKLTSSDLDQQRHHRILLIFFSFLIGFIFLFVIAGGVARVRTHYMFVMVLVSILFFLRVTMADVGERRIKGYAGIISVAAIVVLLGIPIKYFVEPLRCGKCEHHVPYESLARDLKKAGFRTGTIFAYWHPYPIAGNLRIAFPKARVISAKHPSAMPPLQTKSSQGSKSSQGLTTSSHCLLVWSGPAQGSQANNTIRLARQHLKVSVKSGVIANTVDAQLSVGSKKKFTLGYALLKNNLGNCR
jgi:hypothetical protein